MPRVSVLIVDYHSGTLLRRCLDALAKQTLIGFEVLVVDNGADNSAPDPQGETNFRLRVIHPGRNLGFAAANNLAAREACAPWLATLNPDAFPAPNWLERLEAATRRHPGVVSFACTQRNAQEPSVLDGAGDPYSPLGIAWRGGKDQPLGQLPGEGAVFGPCAAAALYRRDVFLDTGGFDETFFCYYEDVDLAFRLRLAGHSCVYVPDAWADHVGSAISGPQSQFSVYHITRNRVWTLVKNMPAGLLLTLSLPTALVLLRSLLRNQTRTKARALHDALRGLPEVLAQRRAIQIRRVVPALQLAKAFTWSFAKMWGSTPDVRPLPPVEPLGDERLCAVVVTYHTDESLRHTLPAILRQVDQLIVVDNGSSADTIEILDDLRLSAGGRLVLLSNEQNLGLARAQNQGIAKALEEGYRWVLLLDDDSMPAPAMVASLFAAYRDAPRSCPIGLLSPRIERLGLGREQAYAIARHPLELRRRTFGDQPILHDLLFAIASGSLIPAAALAHVGRMREEFFIDYVDVDFCLRLREAGYTIIAVADARIEHRLGRTENKWMGGRPVAVTHHNPWRRYHIFRNRASLWRERGLRWPAWVAFDMAAALVDLLRILCFEDARRAKLSSALRGAWDGMRGCYSRSGSEFERS